MDYRALAKAVGIVLATLFGIGGILLIIASNPLFGTILIGIMILIVCIKTGITIYQEEKEKNEQD